MIDGHVADYASRITEKWIAMGDKEKDDVFKFTAYWLAFVQLVNYDKEAQKKKRESARIELFCTNNASLLYPIIDFESDYLDEFKKIPVVKGTESISDDNCEKSITLIEERIREISRKKESFNSEDDIEKIAQDYRNICDPLVNTKRRIVSLFCSIYRVRCNLFHGSKRLADDDNWGRDERLVCASAIILRLCLPTLYESTYSKKYVGSLETP